MEYTNQLETDKYPFKMNFYSMGVYFGFFKHDKQITSVNFCRGYMMEKLGNIMRMSAKNKKDNADIVLGEDDYSGVIVTASIDSHISENTDIVLDFLNLLDTSLNFKPTVIKKVESGNHCNVYKIYMDNRWFHAPFLVSLFTLGIRYIAIFHKKGNSLKRTLKYALNTNYGDEAKYRAQTMWSDNRDFKNSIIFIEKVLRYGIEPFFFEKRKENYIGATIRAHYFGVNALATGNSVRSYKKTKQFEHAHRFKDNRAIAFYIRKLKKEQEKQNKKVLAR